MRLKDKKGGSRKMMMNEMENMKKIELGCFCCVKCTEKHTEINNNSEISFIGCEIDRISLLIGA